ncbi:hypothetical protein APHAL10511_002811 [Amanita phalloides]|nr:hypothetical protein APHAL10511_002811 [Amanita phalloides]
MIALLATQLGKFPGHAHCTWCLVHSVNLVVLIILWKIDICKKSTPNDEDDLAGLAHESDMEQEEKEMDRGTYNDNIAKEAIGDIEAIELELEDDIVSTAKHMKPVQHVLVKVCTIVLPFALI